MIAIWLYFAYIICVLLLVWGFYLVAKIHIYKFREYSTQVRPVTRFVGIFLLVITIIAFYVVFREFDSKPISTAATVGGSTNQLEQY